MEIPSAIIGNYKTTIPNEDIILSTDEVQILTSKEIIQGTANTIIKLLPKPRILIHINKVDRNPMELFRIFIEEKTSKILYLSRNTSAEIVMSQLDQETIDSLLISRTIDSQLKDTPSSILFHIVNFYKYRGDPIKYENGKEEIVKGGRITLNNEKWNIIIDEVPNTEKLIKELDNTGGYAITHVGKITKVDGGNLPIDEVKDILQSLHYYLSFAKGAWAAPILPIGLNIHNENVWESWGISLVDPWNTSLLSWFDIHHANMLTEIFPGYMNISNNSLWEDAIRIAIHLYIECNKQAGALNGSVVLAQSVLELLSWVYLVQQKENLSGDGFRKLPAYDQLSLFLSQIGIPLTIPDTLVELTKFARDNNQNGPEIFTEARNSIVHPYHKQKEKYSRVIYEVWSLGLWYIELSLLSLFNYSGSYSNRLSKNKWVGQVEPLPWHK